MRKIVLDTKRSGLDPNRDIASLVAAIELEGVSCRYAAFICYLIP